MKRWKSSVVFLASLLLCIVSVLVPIRAEAAYGTVSAWSGDFTFAGPSKYITLNNSYIAEYENSSDGSTLSNLVLASYENTCTFYIDIHLLSHVFLDGFAYIDINFNYDASFFGSNFRPDINIDSINLGEDVYYSGNVYYFDNNTMTYRLVINFNSLNCDYGTKLPINLNFQFSGNVDNSLQDNMKSDIIVSLGSSTLVANEVKVYDDVRDLPSVYGDFANQNQQIIDGIDENTGVLEDLTNNLSTWFSDLTSNLSTWFSDQKANINSRFSELTSNLSSWYNGIIQTINSNFEKLLSNYDSSAGEEKNEEFAAGSDELVSIEGDLTDTSNTNIDSYTTTAFDTSIISTLGPSLLYVVTWFTNFWEMGGLFTSLLNVGLALYIAFYILRLRGR